MIFHSFDIEKSTAISAMYSWNWGQDDTETMETTAMTQACRQEISRKQQRNANNERHPRRTTHQRSSKETENPARKQKRLFSPRSPTTDTANIESTR
jgi:hypothetical protein